MKRFVFLHGMFRTIVSFQIFFHLLSYLIVWNKQTSMTRAWIIFEAELQTPSTNSFPRITTLSIHHDWMSLIQKIFLVFQVIENEIQPRFAERTFFVFLGYIPTGFHSIYQVSTKHFIVFGDLMREVVWKIL